MPEFGETPDAPKFLCDEMLCDLARWLRAAGYDTTTPENGDDDRTIVERARHEGRIVLTRDHKITEIAHVPGSIVVLPDGGLDVWARELAAILRVDWLRRPLTRCLECNTALVDPDEAAMARALHAPEALPRPLHYCPRCENLYWSGSHARRMRRRLEEWARQFPNSERSSLTRKKPMA